MNDARWGMASFLVFLGVVSLIGGSLACAAAAPVVLRDAANIDLRHLLMDLEHAVLLLGVAGACMVGALVCADGIGTHPTMRAPRAWNTLWQIRWHPLDVRRLTRSADSRKDTLWDTLREAVPLSAHAAAFGEYGEPEVARVAAGEAIGVSLRGRVRVPATPVLRHGRVRR